MSWCLEVARQRAGQGGSKCRCSACMVRISSRAGRRGAEPCQRNACWAWGGGGRRCSSVGWMGIYCKAPRRGAFTPGSARGREETEAKAAALLLAVKKEAAMIASLRHPNIILFMGEPPLRLPS